jgi:hypothetical protein
VLEVDAGAHFLVLAGGMAQGHGVGSFRDARIEPLLP